MPSFVDRIYTCLLRALFRYETYALEAFLAAEALLTGVWVLFPGEVAFTQATALARVPEELIGGVLTLHGFGSVLALLRGDLHFSRRGALASFALWGFLALALLISPPVTTFTVPLVIVLALGSLWVYLRLYLRWKLGPQAPA